LSAQLPIYVLGPPLAERSLRDHAAEVVRRGLQAIPQSDGPCLVIAPAGITAVDTEDQALEQAEAVRIVARRAGVALLFGVDVGPPHPGAGRLFACFGGAPILWPSVAERGFPDDVKRRVLRIGAVSVLPLFAAEALDVTAARRAAKIEGLSATVVLSHGGATARWRPALSRLEQHAPVIVSAHTGGVGRGYASPGLVTRSLPVSATLSVQPVAA
jgi:hypothetical protein